MNETIAAPEQLTFIIPVRHHQSVQGWSGVCDRLSITLQSIAAQSTNNWQCLVVANREAELPVLPKGVTAIRVDLPLTVLPIQSQNPQAFYDAVRIDKGRRVLAGMMAAPKNGFVMIVDYDDLVSNKLAEFVSTKVGASGWYLDSGWLFDGGGIAFLQRSKFFEVCGTSHIVRRSLFPLPEHEESISPEVIKRWMGSHRFIADDLRTLGAPLEKLPLVGAVYRVGYAGNTSGTGTIIRQRVLRKRNLHPYRLWQAISALALVDTKMRSEYFASQAPR